jgi:hypothetical protein
MTGGQISASLRQAAREPPFDAVGLASHGLLQAAGEGLFQAHGKEKFLPFGRKRRGQTNEASLTFQSPHLPLLFPVHSSSRCSLEEIGKSHPNFGG